jgi:hypothetical protein
MVFSWRPPPLSDGIGKVMSSTLLGGSSNAPDGKVFADGKTFIANSQETKIFKRNKGKPFNLALTLVALPVE